MRSLISRLITSIRGVNLKFFGNKPSISSGLQQATIQPIPSKEGFKSYFTSDSTIQSAYYVLLDEHIAVRMWHLISSQSTIHPTEMHENTMANLILDVNKEGIAWIFNKQILNRDINVSCFYVNKIRASWCSRSKLIKCFKNMTKFNYSQSAQFHVTYFVTKKLHYFPAHIPDLK